jgi:hypothetical protein
MLEAIHDLIAERALADDVVDHFESGEVVVESHSRIDDVSDGYHSFDQLYKHRHALFVALLAESNMVSGAGWYAHQHHDGSSYPGWVLVGTTIDDIDGNDMQISYHLPESYVPHLKAAGCIAMETAPQWDGHTSDDVVTRLLSACGDANAVVASEHLPSPPDEVIVNEAGAAKHLWIASVDEDDDLTDRQRAADALRKEKGISNDVFGQTIFDDGNGQTVIAISGSDDRVVERDRLGHCYSINRGEIGECLSFQQGPVPQYGVNGTTNEAVLSILIHRTEHLNAQFPCVENEVALEHMRAALRSFESRTAKRIARGVEGVEVK